MKKKLVSGTLMPVLGVKLKRSKYFCCFSRKTYVEPRQWEALSETFLMMWLKRGLSRKITKIQTTTFLTHPKQLLLHSQNKVLFLL